MPVPAGEPAGTRPSAAALQARLRAGTAAAHEALESALDLLHQPLDRQRFIRVLTGFHGFHRAWEPALAATLPPPLQPLSRLPLIEDDLRRLGLDAAALHEAPACTEAAFIEGDADAALGSLYVLEGSTLGGRVISRAVAGAAWCPPGGLRYFDPYGAATGRRWRCTLDRLAAAAADAERVEAGALRTFRVLQEWLVAAAHGG